MIVTRTLISDTPPSLQSLCKTMGFVRADIWRRYGALGNVWKSAVDIRKEITVKGFYSSLAVDGTIRAETTKDIVNDVLLYKAAAVTKVRSATNCMRSKRNIVLLGALPKRSRLKRTILAAKS